MPSFGRDFDLRKLGSSPDGVADWFTDLLSLWRPAGQGAGEYGLRLAVRNGYLNFYRCGQSVARVGFGRGGVLRAEVHAKYVRKREGEGQTYARLIGSSLSHSDGETQAYGGLEMLKEWVGRCEGYSGKEKEFVDRIVGRNDSVVDLEMALPAFTPAGSKRTAPRMDLVALEPTSSGQRLVFWEAKCMGDGRLRARDGLPEVVGQLSAYRDWLEHGSNLALVREAYRKNCAILFNLHKQAQSASKEVGGLGTAIVAALQDGIADVDVAPRLLIDDPTGLRVGRLTQLSSKASRSTTSTATTVTT
jgi:hypothetical protein